MASTESAELTSSEENRVRLFSVAGIKGERESEQRATSAVLAVLTVVRPFFQAMMSPLGASRSDRAVIDAWTEVPLETPDGATVRPDGVLRCALGKNSFTAAFEAKTGDTKLDLDQIGKYLSVCRAQGFDCLVTISGEVAPFDGAHPTPGAAALAKQHKVALHHWSWTRLLSTAARECTHYGISDPEQSWILSEFVRYLEHPNAGVTASSDMGEHWTAVRDAARDNLLTRATVGIEDICSRWDQLMHSIALRLSADLGCEVREMVKQAHRKDPGLRLREAVQRACGTGTLVGALRVPDAISDIDVTVDLRAGRIITSVECSAPVDKGGRGRVSWLVKQLRRAPDDLTVEAFSHKSKTPEIASLGDLRTDSKFVLRGPDKPPVRFRVASRSEMGAGRRTVRKLGFADSVTSAVDIFYNDIVQHMKKAVAPAPKRPEPVAEAPSADWPFHQLTTQPERAEQPESSSKQEAPRDATSSAPSTSAPYAEQAS